MPTTTTNPNTSKVKVGLINKQQKMGTSLTTHAHSKDIFLYIMEQKSLFHLSSPLPCNFPLSFLENSLSRFIAAILPSGYPSS